MVGGVRIVVAEDEAVIRMDLAEMLREEGYAVVGQAPNGLAAVDLVESLSPDALLVDIAMPGLDGIEVTRRTSERTAVVVVTAFGQRDRVEQARDAGAMAYLVKPVGRADLMPTVEMAVAGWRTLQELRGRAREAEGVAEAAARAAEAASRAATDSERRLADRRDVERAKGLVQQRAGLDEESAYRWLRETAMDRRMPLADLARAVIAGEG